MSRGCHRDLYPLGNSERLNVAEMIQTLSKQPDTLSPSQRFVLKTKKLTNQRRRPRLPDRNILRSVFVRTIRSLRSCQRSKAAADTAPALDTAHCQEVRDFQLQFSVTGGHDPRLGQRTPHGSAQSSGNLIAADPGESIQRQL